MLKNPERTSFDARFARLYSIDAQTILTQQLRHSYTIDKVGLGGVMRIGGETYLVQKTAVYKELSENRKKTLDYTVTELVLIALHTGAIRYIEWAIDDELEISFTERKLSTGDLNSQLRHADGSTLDIDEEIDDLEDGLLFNGQTYRYEDDWPCHYTSSDGRSHQATIYEFGSDRIGWLTIEAWGEGEEWEYEGYLSETIHPTSIEVLSTGKVN